MSQNSTQTAYSPSLFNEYTIAFEGSSVACILYGIYLAITGFNMTLLQKKRYYILLTYSIVQLVLTTLYFAISLYIAPAQSLGIFNIMGSYTPDALSPWPSIVVDALFVLNTWASDAFLLYRCYVVCMENMYAWALPLLLYLATVGASLAWLVVSSIPGAVYSTHTVQVAGICYWSCSVVMNICTTCFISVKLWIHRRSVSKVLGPQQGVFYVGYMAMTLESALLYTMFVIIALVVFVLNSPLENVFFPLLGTIQAIAPSLIIYRIARGLSFKKHGTESFTLGSLRFASSVPAPGIVRPTHQEMLGGSGTVHTSSGISDKVDLDGSDSFVQDIKEDV